MSTQFRVQAYADFFENITVDTTLHDYQKFFDDNVYFEDPFQKVFGITKVYTIFQHMYETLYQPSFKVDETLSGEGFAYLHWTFNFKRNNKDIVRTFSGVSRIEFNEAGTVISHVDYWDAAEHIYEQIPMLGSILRYIKSKIAA